MFKKYRIVKQSDYTALEEKAKRQKEEIETAASYIKSIGSESLTDSFLFQDSILLSELKSLQHKLEIISKEEKQRNWSAEGIAYFSQLLRSEEKNLKELANLLTSKVVHYVKAVQGSLFILSDDNRNAPVLELVASYAFNRQKYLSKTIEIGEGLVGQCFLEKETILLTEVPEDYISITSGLGEAPPKCILIIPLKYNDEVLGILELASFMVFPPHVIHFLEKMGENFASSISSLKIKEQTNLLLIETQAQTEQMRAQEEELRQNLEELEATQEEINRKQIQLDQKGQLMQIVLDNIPIPVFVKDDTGCYTMINKAESVILGKSENEVVGKDDTFFTTDESEIKAIRTSDTKALLSDQPIELQSQEFTGSDNKKFVFKTTKVSFLNNLTGKRNIIGVSVDLSDQMKLEQNLMAEKVIQQNNVMIDLAGRQRMLSQKIGFLSEMIFRGKTEYIVPLQKVLDLHETSLNVLKEGGMPPEMAATVPLEKADKALINIISEIEVIWDSYKNGATELCNPNQTNKSKQNAIEIVENLGESLLIKNNQLVTEYKKIIQNKLLQIR